MAEPTAESRARKAADRALGQRGEAVAEATACTRGWQPWQRNARIGGIEVDLAMLRQRDGKTELLVAEVKASRLPIDDPIRRWPPQRQRRLWRAAEALSVACRADRVEVALIGVVLRASVETVIWWVAEAPGERAPWR